ncbi:MAG: 4Fe-4S dicluster domain-containing protein [Nitrospirae bacterium]|nr:MAG: 4Fe-4S dicluster domain-containing protein [Nitrospirota bacterium]
MGEKPVVADPQYGRRHFLKDSVLSVAKTAQEFVKHRDASPEQAKPEPAARTDWLRPPGAVAEALFLERCTRCGDCLKVCPYGSIKPEPKSGTPVIFPDETPCHLCEDFPCISACGTEALLSVAGREEVAMGVAVVSHRICTAGQGCHACVSRCPTEALAMDFDSFRLVVMKERCVGCGLCEQTCKTVNDKVAITITPTRVLASGGGAR